MSRFFADEYGQEKLFVMPQAQISVKLHLEINYYRKVTVFKRINNPKLSKIFTLVLDAAAVVAVAVVVGNES